MKVNFKVSEAKGKDPVQVELDVNVEGVTVEQLLPYALRSYVIEVQGQFRPNWATFIKGEYNKTPVFGEKLFASNRGGVTLAKAEETVTNKVKTFTPLEKLEWMLEKEMITEEQFDALYEQLPEDQQ